MRNTIFFLMILTVGVSLFSCPGSATGNIEHPNIVFILADDMNRDCWGVYGSIDCKTPNIDKLAEEGLRFERAYTSVAMCAPFRQELYSGRSPWRTGTLANHSKSNPETKSIAHYLKPLGYRVALSGKSHIGPKDCYPFEYLETGGDETEDRNHFYLEAAGKFIDSCTEEGKPFCLFIASNDSHGPYTTGDRSIYNPASFTIPPYWLDTPILREELVTYYAEITNFDKLVGTIRKDLEKRKLWDNTVFIVCSEQGTSFPFAKWTCYDNGLHTGMVVHWNGVTKAGSSVSELVSMADLTPTLVEIAGGKLQPGDCDGKSFLKMLKGKEQVNHEYLYGAFTNCNIIGSRDRIYPIRVIRNKSFNLIYNPNFDTITSNVTLDKALKMIDNPSFIGNDVASSWVELSRNESYAEPFVQKFHHRPEYELYNLQHDPYELKNEINNPEYQGIIQELKNQLHTKLAELGDSDPIATEKTMVDPTRKNN